MKKKNNKKNDEQKRFEDIIRMARKEDWSGISLAFQPLVLNLAKKFEAKGVEFIDLCQVGNTEISEVLDRYRKGQCDLQWLVRTIKWRVAQGMARYALKTQREYEASTTRVEWVELGEAQRDAVQLELDLDTRDAFERVLTKTEQDMAQAYASGMPLREIADHLGVSPQTVSTDMAEIRRKLRLALDGVFDDKASTETRGRKRKPRGGGR